jgi:2'-aminobiphenyl-2,3-diol 1,2-dioxygenase small subunit
MASYATHKLLQSLCRSPELAERMNREPEKLCAELGIGREETQALVSRDPAALAKVGVHPILQIHFMIAVSPEFREKMDTSALQAKLS